MKLLFAFILIFVTADGFAQADSVTQKFSKENFSISYPASWRLDTSGIMKSECIFYSPLEDITDKFSDNVNVLIQDLTGKNIDLAKYKQITEGQIVKGGADCKIIESVIKKSGNAEYYTVSYTIVYGKMNLRIKSICYIKNTKAYLITLTTEMDKYEKYQKVGEDMLKSFELTE